jgi:hypothetical protein
MSDKRSDMITCEMKQVFFSYIRTASVAMASVYIALGGEVFDKSGLQALVYAGIISVAGPAARAINPNDDAFGKSKKDDIDAGT